MKALKLTALLFSAALFTGIGATTLIAEDMKCGAGKCGSSMKAPMKASKCGDDKMKSSKCGDSKMKSSKCGDGKMTPKKPVGKCGVGKCS